jgi:hypothetical protein
MPHSESKNHMPFSNVLAEGNLREETRQPQSIDRVKKRGLFQIDTWLLNWFSKAEAAIGGSLARRIA